MERRSSAVTEGFVAEKLTTRGGGAGPGLGTLRGVYFPCLQNILGVILFLRLPWIAGQAGIFMSIAVVVLCVATTIPTALSITAIATNGRIPAGGPYYVVSRNLGAAFGGAIGFLFFLGTALGATLYILGATETFRTGFNMEALDPRLIAVCLMTVLAFIVYVGIEWVNRVAGLFLASVIVSICLSLGGLIAFGAGAEFGSTAEVKRATAPALTTAFEADLDTGRVPTFQSLVALFYPSVTGIMAGSNRSGLLEDPGTAIPLGTLGAIFTTSVLYILVVVLFASIVDRGTLKANKLVIAFVAWPVQEVVTVGILMSSIGAGLQSLVGAPQLLATMLDDEVLPFAPYIRYVWDLATGPIVNLFRPAASSSGSSSGSSAAAGTAAATATSTPTASSGGGAGASTGPGTGAGAGAKKPPVVRRPSTFRPARPHVRERTASEVELELAERGDAPASWTGRPGEEGEAGAASAGAVVPAHEGLADPNEDVVDNPGESSGKPPVTAGLTEVAITWFLASAPCLAGNLDLITPIQTMFFLMMYVTINLACLILTLWPTAGFRPKRPVYWLVPLFGVAICVVVMMLVQWWQALVGFAIAAGLYYWISSGEQDESWGSWGSSLDAMRLGNAHAALLALKDRTFTPKNWRPQLLVLLQTDEDGDVERPELLALCGQLKKGGGLTMAAAVLEGELLSLLNEEAERRQGLSQRERLDLPPEYDTVILERARRLQRELDWHGARGFAQVMASPDVAAGMTAAVQSSGLGPLAPNALLVGWPRHWDLDMAHARGFVAFLKSSLRMRKSLLVLKADPREDAPEDAPACYGADGFTSAEVPAGTIDVWWMRKDSGLLLLLPFLLSQHPRWAGRKLRLFAIDKAAAGRRAEIEAYLDAIRIPAEVHVITVDGQVIDEALSGRTLTKGDRERLKAQLDAARGGAEGAGAASAVEASSLTMATGGGPTKGSLTDLFPSLKDSTPKKPEKEPEKEPEKDEEDGDGDEGADSAFVTSAKEINKHIREHSAGAAIVIANLMLTRAVAPDEFMRYTEEFTRGVPRAILVRGSGDEIITLFA